MISRSWSTSHKGQFAQVLRINRPNLRMLLQFSWKPPILRFLNCICGVRSTPTPKRAKISKVFYSLKGQFYIRRNFMLSFTFLLYQPVVIANTVINPELFTLWNTTIPSNVSSPVSTAYRMGRILVHSVFNIEPWTSDYCSISLLHMLL